MHWSWGELEATPAYVVRYCADLMRIRRAAEADAQEEANRRSERER